MCFVSQNPTSGGEENRFHAERKKEHVPKKKKTLV